MNLPSGVVTFLFSDIEGSTRRWESDTTGMRRSLARHDELFRDHVASAGGHVFKHTGDGFAAVFESGSAGLAAAATVSAALETEPWGGPALVVRIGLNSGKQSRSAATTSARPSLVPPASWMPATVARLSSPTWLDA